MKKILVACILLSGIASFGFKNAEITDMKDVKVTVTFNFANIEEGYDHLTKTELYIDGSLVGTSTNRKQSEENVVIATTSKGNHHVRVVNYAYYEGNWEEHTIANNYSIDCLYEADLNLKKKNNKIKLLFDIDNGTKREK